MYSKSEILEHKNANGTVAFSKVSCKVGEKFHLIVLQCNYNVWTKIYYHSSRIR